LLISQQFDPAHLIIFLAARKHFVGRTWPSDRMFDLAGSYEMRVEKKAALLPNMGR